MPVLAITATGKKACAPFLKRRAEIRTILRQACIVIASSRVGDQLDFCHVKRVNSEQFFGNSNDL